MTPPKERDGTQEREPYEAPRIEESGKFEHLVLACDQGPPPNYIPGVCDAPDATWTS